MENYQIVKIGDFVEYVKFLKDECKDNDYLFRGQREGWALLPKIARDVKPLNGKSVLDIERLIFDEYERISRPYLRTVFQSEWELLVIGQHHGLPTRLLDWSKNALAALWFAVRKPATKPVEPKKQAEPGVVWIYRHKDESDVEKGGFHNPFDISYTMPVCPPHVTKRIIAQSGWFTAHAWNTDEKKFTPFEEERPDKLRKLVIPASVFSEMRFHLNQCGIHEASLFPNLDSICRQVKAMYTLEKDQV